MPRWHQLENMYHHRMRLAPQLHQLPKRLGMLPLSLPLQIAAPTARHCLHQHRRHQAALRVLLLRLCCGGGRWRSPQQPQRPLRIRRPMRWGGHCWGPKQGERERQQMQSQKRWRKGAAPLLQPLLMQHHRAGTEFSERRQPAHPLPPLLLRPDEAATLRPLPRGDTTFIIPTTTAASEARRRQEGRHFPKRGCRRSRSTIS